MKKKILSVCLILTMVLGMFGSVNGISAKASDTAISAVVSGPADKTIADGLFRFRVQSNGKYLDTAHLYGTVYENGTLRENAKLTHYADGGFYYVSLNQTAVQGTEGPTIKLGGTYATSDGATTVELTEISFKYNGTQWVFGEIPTVEVESLVLPTLTDNLVRFQFDSAVTMPAESLSGTIYVNGSTSVTTKLTRFGDHQYYVDFGTSAVAGTEGPTVKIGGHYVSTNGTGFYVPETTFKFTGTRWVFGEIPTLEVESLVLPTLTDNLVRFQFDSAVTMPAESLSGTIYVNGSTSVTTKLTRFGDHQYYVDFGTSAVAGTEGPTVKIGGCYASTSGLGFDVPETTFKFNGTRWVFVETRQVTVAKVIDDYATDTHIRFSAPTTGLNPAGNLIGDVYVDGNLATDRCINRYAAGVSYYVVYMDGYDVKKGTTIEIGGLYTRTDGRNVEFTDACFVYDGDNWKMIDIDLDMLDVCYQNADEPTTAGRADIRFIASVDSLDYNRAGFVFSLTNEVPNFTSDVTTSTTTVYGSLLADEQTMTAEGLYPECSSKYLFAFPMSAIPNGATIHVRAYVETLDGLIVCGEPISVTATVAQ